MRLKSWMRPFVPTWQLLRDTFKSWNDDNASRLSAALAYYTIFSLAPLLILVIAIAGFFFGESTARSAMLEQVERIIGATGAQYLDNLIEAANQRSTGILATLIGLGTLFVGATRVFAELQTALNEVWDVTTGSGIKYYLRKRLISFALVFTLGVLLVSLLVLSALIGAAGKYLFSIVPSYLPVLAWMNSGISFGVTLVFFAAIYKILPDARVRWKDVWAGAFAAALLFSIGRYFIGLYLGRGSFASIYGAAGSFVAILFWVYVSAQILFLGAEFTQAYAKRQGRALSLQKADASPRK